MECLITAAAAIAAALYTTLRVEKTLRRATESVSEKREQRQRAEVQRAELSSTAKLEEATKLPPIAYVRGGIEIGAKPGYKIRFVAGEIILSYYERGEPRAVRITFFRRGKGAYTVIQ
ncbi:MAG: hypothetical protein QXR68_00365 [Pyrobaculum sp.]